MKIFRHKYMLYFIIFIMRMFRIGRYMSKILWNNILEQVREPIGVIWGAKLVSNLCSKTVFCNDMSIHRPIQNILIMNITKYNIQSISNYFLFAFGEKMLICRRRKVWTGLFANKSVWNVWRWQETTKHMNLQVNV